MNRRLRRLLALATLAVMLMGMLPVQATSEHVHQWGPYILDKAATCTEDGLEYRICSAPNCPQPDAEEIHTIARLGHIWGPWNLKTQPTCTDAGSEQRFCTRCGVPDATLNTLPALGHAWGPWNMTTAADCTNAGVETRICTRCAISETRPTAALGHAWGAWSVTKAADCTNAGSQTRVCTRCAVSETGAIPALGHSWGAWAVTTAATCSKAGEQTRVCTRCQTVEKQAILPLGKDQANGHKFGAWVELVKKDCLTVGQEQRTCADCGRLETRDTGKGKHQPKPNWYALPEPTLEKPGRKVRYCAICDKIVESEEYGLKGYVYEMPALNFGPRAKTLFTPLVEFKDRFTPLDLSADGETIYPLVTEDGYYIADLKINVLNDTLTVIYEMKDPETVVKSELLFLFDDAFAVTPMDLNNVAATLRYGDTIPLNGRTYLVMDARLLVNYNQEHIGNKPFSDNGVYLDGMTQNSVILQDMSVKLIDGVTPE